ncbi:MAG TPA: hypothetical protein VIW73_08890 [Candidatus Cybelea sp.]
MFSDYDGPLVASQLARAMRAAMHDGNYDPLLGDVAKRIAMLGGDEADVAAALGTTTKQVQRWISGHEEFRAAVLEGRLMADANVATATYHAAIGHVVPEERVFVNVLTDYDDEGRAMTQRIVTTRVIGKRYYPPDVKAAQFWLKNKQPNAWRDAFSLEETRRTEHVVTFKIARADGGGGAVIDGTADRIEGSGANGAGGQADPVPTAVAVSAAAGGDLRASRRGRKPGARQRDRGEH